jgi:phospholipid/cholesterol/gamma-HCH transport system ATP-binding protein
MAERAPIIELRGIDKSFAKTVIFRGMNLAVYEGETLSILGESGTGKSVALKMMLGLATPDHGQALVHGEDVAAMDSEALQKLRREIAYVFQEDALFDSLTVLENVGYALYEHTRQSDAEIRARVKECVEMVGLQERVIDLFPANLSGGMRKRVGLARALAFRPKVVLFDDPTRGLDPQSITIVGRTLRRLHRELKMTSVLVTHDLRTAFHVSDRLAILDDHGFPYVGTLDELRALKNPEIEGFLYDPEEDLWGDVMSESDEIHGE